MLELRDVGVWVPGRAARLLDRVDLRLATGEHLAVLGPNGAGKTTLLQILSGRRHPSTGTVSLLGRPLGQTELAWLRRRIGLVDAAERVPGRLSLRDYLLTGVGGTVQSQAWLVGPGHRRRADQLLDELGLDPAQPVGTVSAGELARARIARGLVADPALLVLDEPAAGLDLAAREQLLATLDRLAVARRDLATVTVTHHVEELPASTTHLLLLREGRVVAAGPVAEVLTGPLLSRAFGWELQVIRSAGRWYARSVAGQAAGMQIRHVPERNRYEIVLGEEVVGLADYRDSDGVRVFSHTETDPAHQGQGLAARLVQFALDDTRTAGHRVVPACGYVARYIDEHPQYADLLAG